MITSFLVAMTAILAAVTLLPWLPWSHGLVRICDFPRIQIAVLAAVLVLLTIQFGPNGAFGWTLSAVQVAILAVQASFCVRFTPLHRVQSLRHDGAPDAPSAFRLISSNVKMSNRRYGDLIELVRETKPDLLILMEIDDAWLEALRPLRSQMPYSVECPKENSYGMVLLSTLPLSDSEIRFLVIDEVPSFRTTVQLRSGDTFRLYTLHPEPPVPYMDTLGRDAELILVGKEVVDDPLPCIVTGDLNDVAWSRTTRRFQRLSGLLDPRVGRGFFNSFDSRYLFLRWPLDHLFHDAEFRLIRLERLRNIGSDHFPMLFELALHRRPASAEAPSRPDEGDVEEAQDVLEDASTIEREPVGAGWEK